MAKCQTLIFQMGIANELMSGLIIKQIDKLDREKSTILVDDISFRICSYKSMVLSNILNDISIKEDSYVDDYIESLLYDLYIRKVTSTDEEIILITTSMIEAVEELLLNFV